MVFKIGNRRLDPQEQALRTNSVKHRIPRPLRHHYADFIFIETACHTVSRCRKLAQREYRTWHYGALRVYRELGRRYG